MAADRGAYIDQSQSLNIHLAGPTFGKMSQMHFYAWKRGLNTGLYYLRTRPAADPIKFTVDKSKLKNSKPIEPAALTTLKTIEPDTSNEAPAPETTTTATTTLPTAPAVSTNGVDKEIESNTSLIEQLKLVCSKQNKEACLMCSS